MELSSLDVVEKVQLAILTVAALGPATVLPTAAAEGRVAAEEDVHRNSKRPEVAALVVLKILVGVLNEGLHDLWSHKLGRANWSVQQRSGVGAAPGVELYDLKSDFKSILCRRFSKGGFISIYRVSYSSLLK